jgi:hypothetical protein
MGWFDGPSQDDSRELEFVAALARAAVEGAFPGVEPDGTMLGLLAKPEGAGIAVSLTVPGLSSSRRHLIVSYEPGPVNGTPVLQSEWSSSTQLSVQPGAYDGPSSDLDLGQRHHRYTVGLCGMGLGLVRSTTAVSSFAASVGRSSGSIAAERSGGGCSPASCLPVRDT